MEIINAMVASGCFIGIAVYAADIIRPDDKFSSQIKFVFSAFFIIAFLSPLMMCFNSNIEMPDISDKNVEYTDIESAAMEDLKYFTEKNTENAIYDILNEAGINCENVNVVCELKNGFIKISKIELRTSSNSSAEIILAEKFGKDVIIDNM